MNTSNPTTVVLSKDAAEKIAAAMRKRGEKAGDYFSRAAGVAVAPGTGGEAVHPAPMAAEGGTALNNLFVKARDNLLVKQARAGAASVQHDLAVTLGVYDSPNARRSWRWAQQHLGAGDTPPGTKSDAPEWYAPPGGSATAAFTGSGTGDVPDDLWGAVPGQRTPGLGRTRFFDVARLEPEGLRRLSSRTPRSRREEALGRFAELALALADPGTPTGVLRHLAKVPGPEVLARLGTSAIDVSEYALSALKARNAGGGLE